MDEPGAALEAAVQLRCQLEATTLADADTEKLRQGFYTRAANMTGTDKLNDIIWAVGPAIEVVIVTSVANGRTEAANAAVESVMRTGRRFRK